MCADDPLYSSPSLQRDLNLVRSVFLLWNPAFYRGRLELEQLDSGIDYNLISVAIELVDSSGDLRLLVDSELRFISMGRKL